MKNERPPPTSWLGPTSGPDCLWYVTSEGSGVRDRLLVVDLHAPPPGSCPLGRYGLFFSFYEAPPEKMPPQLPHQVTASGEGESR